MFVSVAKAKTKQCRAVPLVLLPKPTSVSLTKQEMQWQPVPCAGPDCMAWQWADGEDERAGNAGKDDARGYCGFVPR